MLIVVAIIAILVAVSIPIVGQALERARKATDAANERAAKAEFTICYLNGKLDGADFPDISNPNKIYYYDAVNGKLTTDRPSVGYGKCTASHKGKVLAGKMTADGDLTLGWMVTEGGDIDTANNHNGAVDN